MDWSTIAAVIGYVFAAFMLGYVFGWRSNERAWCALFERLTTIMEKQEETLRLYVESEEMEEREDEGEGWKER